MIIARSSAELDRAIATLRTTTDCRGTHVAFVPTMGALHDGHLELVRSAVRTGGITVASVFVNPTQFGPDEDFDSYPRDADSDCSLLESAGCDILFLPSLDDIYPDGFATEVLADRSLTACLCAQSRGDAHFDGVTTVVARLFALVRPDSAHFGEKDWQQLRIVSRMAADIRPEIEIVACPTVRESDGLARSSRNAYLTGDQRSSAASIPRALEDAIHAILCGRSSVKDALTEAESALGESGLEVEYLELRDGDDLSPLDELDPELDPNGPAGRARLFVAARLGHCRLIDNAPLLATGATSLTHQRHADPAGTARGAALTG